MMMLILFVFFSIVAHATLPPGWEDDELYCAAGCCLRERVGLKEGMTGRRSMLYECCNTSSREVSRPWGWGERLPRELKDIKLISGWHQGECTLGEARMCPSGRTNRTKTTFLLITSVERVSKII